MITLKLFIAYVTIFSNKIGRFFANNSCKISVLSKCANNRLLAHLATVPKIGYLQTSGYLAPVVQ